MDRPLTITSNLTKEYGKRRVLDRVNLLVPYGALYGFIGSNGAGKTTTIRILLGMTAATSGSAQVLGQRRGKLPAVPISGIAYLPQITSELRAKDALVALPVYPG